MGNKLTLQREGHLQLNAALPSRANLGSMVDANSNKEFSSEVAKSQSYICAVAEDEMKVNCPFCNESFEYEFALIEHLPIHAEELKRKIQKRHFEFPTGQTTQRELKIVEGTPSIPMSNLCSNKTRTTRDIAFQRTIRCPSCDGHFRSLRGLNIHVGRCHKTSQSETEDADGALGHPDNLNEMEPEMNNVQMGLSKKRARSPYSFEKPPTKRFNMEHPGMKLLPSSSSVGNADSRWRKIVIRNW